MLYVSGSDAHLKQANASQISIVDALLTLSMVYYDSGVEENEHKLRHKCHVRLTLYSILTVGFT